LIQDENAGKRFPFPRFEFVPVKLLNHFRYPACANGPTTLTDCKTL